MGDTGAIGGGSGPVQPGNRQGVGRVGSRRGPAAGCDLVLKWNWGFMCCCVTYSGDNTQAKTLECR